MADQESVRGGAGGIDRQRRPSPDRDGDEEKRGFDMEIWWEERSLPAKILLGIGFAIAGLALLALLGWVVMLLWNWLIPEIFGLPSVSYWQAWGLLVLCWILFKSWGFKDNDRGSDRRRRKHLQRYMQEDQLAGADEPATSAQD
jgi:hypothetical protein